MTKELLEKIQKLEDENKRLKFLIDKVPGNLYLKDKEGRYLICSEQMSKVFNSAGTSDIIGMTDYELIPDEYRAKIIETDQEIIRTRQAQVLEEIGFDEAGKRATYLSHKIPLIDESGAVEGVFGISLNVTQQKKLEEELHRLKLEAETAREAAEEYLLSVGQEVIGSEKLNHLSTKDQAENIRYFLQAIIDNIPASIYWKDKNGKILGCNKEMLHIFKTTRAHCIGCDEFELLEKSVAENIRKIDQGIMSENKPKTLEEKNYDSSGNLLAIYLTHKVPLHDKEGKVIGILGVSIDVTDKKALEDKLKTAELKIEEQETKMNSMKAMSASIAHEFRTPLNAILCGAKGAEKFFPQLIEAYQKAKTANLDIPVIQKRHLEILKDSLKHIVDEANYSNTIINMMLANVRGTETDQQDFSPYQMVETVKEAVERYPYKNSEERDFVHFDEKNDFTYSGDRDLMIHIIFNLLKNAIYYVLKARKGKIIIRLETGKSQHKLYFKDTGMGIAADVLPHIFEHFFSRTINGSGIGLFYCHQVMKAFGGDILCHSKEGEYAEFILTFPVVKKI